MRHRGLLLTLAAGVLAVSPAFAQNYPEMKLRLNNVVPGPVIAMSMSGDYRPCSR